MINTSREFAYWLQGYFEISGATTLDERQVSLIKETLTHVFFHDIDPTMGDAEHQNKLHQAHRPNDRSGIEAMC